MAAESKNIKETYYKRTHCGDELHPYPRVNVGGVYHSANADMIY